jgi:pyridinium-3,5-bisthiocarboxylic acid mononucleotide nickel chelatase
MTEAPPPSPPSSAAVHAWLDVSAGVAGDMLLGALLDAGAPLGQVQTAVDSVLPGTVRLGTAVVNRAGMRATKADIRVLSEDHPHRTWHDIASILAHSDLAEPAKAKALSVFARLAEAEGQVHGIPPAEVHFHEVGAWDSIADVVGVCAALGALGVASISASAVSLGSGRARGAHGDMPVPVPAVLEMSRGWQVTSGGTGELATPTGMALVRALASVCEPLPRLTVTGVGVGAGTKDTEGRANVVRAVLGTRPEADVAGAPVERLWVVEANIDDLDPRVWPSVLATLMESGAADAWLTPILMKKGRPAHTLSVLCAPADSDALRARIFELTSTFGAREYAVDRLALERDWRSVPVLGGTVRIKLSLSASDGVIAHATPEFEDAAALAGRLGLPVRRVLDEALVAAGAAGLRPGASPPPVER